MRGKRTKNNGYERREKKERIQEMRGGKSRKIKDMRGKGKKNKGYERREKKEK